MTCPYICDLPELDVAGFKPTLKGCSLQPMYYTAIVQARDSVERRRSYLECPEKGYRDNYEKCPYYLREIEKSSL